MRARPQIKALVILADEICRDGQLLEIVDGEGRFVVLRMEFGIGRCPSALAIGRPCSIDRPGHHAFCLPHPVTSWQSEVRMRDGVALSRWTGSGRPLAKLPGEPAATRRCLV
jgi:hypothetical protein